MSEKQCVCVGWADCRPLWIKHHAECPCYDPAKDGTDLIKRLCTGIECWASDEDGVHPECWEAYEEAKYSIGEPLKSGGTQ